MDDPTSPTSSRSQRMDELARSLGQERSQIEEFLSAQRERLRTAHAHLAAQVERIAKDLARACDEHARAEGDLESRAKRVEEEAGVVARLREELQAAQADWQAAQDRAAEQQNQLAAQIERQQAELGRRLEELAQRQAEVAEAQAQLAHDRHGLALLRDQNEAEAQSLAQQRESLQEQTAALAAEREALAELRSKTESQRRHIARELDAQRVAHRKEVARAQKELESRLAEARQGRESLDRERSGATEASAADAAELQSLRAERDGLEDRLKAAQEEATSLRRQLDEALSASSDSSADDYRRRYEMAMDDLRELKQRNADLETRLSRAGAPAAAATAPFGHALDWETQKQRILAALEADYDEDDEHQARERIRIEEVIRTTQQIIDEKDREILELRQILEDQSSQVGQMAVGAAAFAEIVDQDAIVQEERASLKRLQEELREKLKKAEIDISIERAKIARERIELEEKIRHLGLDQPQAPQESPEPEKPSRGRWLSRLGLKDDSSGNPS